MTRPPPLSEVCRYVSERTGSALSRQQLARLEEAITSRLGKRDASGYLAHLRSLGGAPELAELMSVISVHKTDLFRDEQQLAAVSAKVLPALLTEKSALEVWSAGCATGEEVATLLILLEEAGASGASSVLGTDIAATALKTAEALTFAPEAMKRVPAPIRDRHFHLADGRYTLNPTLAARAGWQRHNLMDHPYPLPPKGPSTGLRTGGGFDLIVCRNVLIYFTETAWEQVVTALTDRLRPGGVLVLGAAEPLLGKNDRLEVIRTPHAFFYRRRTGNTKPVAPVQRSAPAPVRSPARRTTTPQEAPTPNPRGEGERLFAQVLEWAGRSDDQTEAGLRQALYLAPDLAPARYLLGMLAEQRGANADASSEYRRALSALAGANRQTPFFLNPARLKLACEQALKRLGHRG